MDATQRIQQIFCEADFNKQLKLFLDKGWKLVDICMDSIALAEGKSFSGETHELESLNTRFLHWLNKYTVHVYETCHCPPSNLTPTLTRIKYLIGHKEYTNCNVSQLSGRRQAFATSTRCGSLRNSKIVWRTTRRGTRASSSSTCTRSR